MDIRAAQIITIFVIHIKKLTNVLHDMIRMSKIQIKELKSRTF